MAIDFKEKGFFGTKYSMVLNDDHLLVLVARTHEDRIKRIPFRLIRDMSVETTMPIVWMVLTGILAIPLILTLWWQAIVAVVLLLILIGVIVAWNISKRHYRFNVRYASETVSFAFVTRPKKYRFWVERFRDRVVQAQARAAAGPDHEPVVAMDPVIDGPAATTSVAPGPESDEPVLEIDTAPQPERAPMEPGPQPDDRPN